MRDNHLHTYFSYDSDADFRDYLEHYDGEIVTTEHLDLSNHNGKFDYLEKPVLQFDKMKFIPTYLKEMEEAIESISAHVLAHFDYGFRKFNVTVEELKNFEAQLRALFQKMIEHNLAFELNCKSMYLYDHEDIYIYALSLVKELGGTKYSVGSDAHTLEHFRLNFDRIKQILTEFDIDEGMLL